MIMQVGSCKINAVGGGGGGGGGGGVVAPQSPQFHLAASSLMALTAESEVKCYQSLSHNWI